MTAVFRETLWRFRKYCVYLQREFEIYIVEMAYSISEIVIKRPTRACLDKLHQIGIEKARKAYEAKLRWERGEYDKSRVSLI